MEFNVKSGNPEKQRTACLIIAVSQQRKLSKAGEMIDKASKGFLSTIILILRSVKIPAAGLK